jgi:osmotically inducible protein OsmC
MAVMQRRAEVTWTGDLRSGSGVLHPGSGAFPDQTVTFSARTEAQEGTTPEELIAAAHATCYSMAFSNTLAQAGHAPEELRVTAECTLDRVEGGLKITTMALKVQGKATGIDAAKFEELARTAEQRCPVSNALRGNVEITLDAALES